MKRMLLAMMAAGAAACGGGSNGGTPLGPGVLTTDTFSGVTTQTAVNSCGGYSHNIVAREGDISVRLVATSDPNNTLSIQVCGGGTDTAGNCAIPQQRISVGQTLTGARKGVSQQNVKALPFACVFTSTFDPTPMTYTLSVTYLK
jgi:hypothetical protein